MLRFFVRCFIAYPYAYFYVYRRALKFKIQNYLYDRKIEKIKQIEKDQQMVENLDRIKKNWQKTIQRPDYSGLQIAAQYSNMQTQAALGQRQSQMYHAANNSIVQKLSRQMQSRQLVGILEDSFNKYGH